MSSRGEAGESVTGGHSEYELPIAALPQRAHPQLMLRRSIVTALWFFAGWSAAALVAFAVGLPGWIAPVGALAAATLVASDPFGQFWARRAPGARIARGIVSGESLPRSL